ncbi:MAG: 5'-3' exonuclease H3TH domain-containing protein [Acidimicrobiales bacterium]
MQVYLIDGTYELFRQYFGRPSSAAADGKEIGATKGVVWSVATLLSKGVTHVGVATDHVIESFRNDLWAGYKSGAEVPEELKSQFPLLEDALESLGVRVFAMTELEADDALASAAVVASEDPRVDQVLICTPDKDLAQSVVQARVVQLDRRTGVVTDEEGVRDRYGIAPASIPDWLALVGDSADGFPGLSGWGRRSASLVLAHYGHIEAIPDAVTDWEPEVVRTVRSAANLAARLAAERELAMLFRVLATLRVDRGLLKDVDELRWRGTAPGFEDMCRYLRDDSLAARMAALGGSRAS